MNFKTINEFRKNATNEDLVELATYISGQKNKSKCLPTEKYNFSYSAAVKFLEEKGVYSIKHREKSIMSASKTQSEGKERFFIDFDDDTEYVARSVVLKKRIAEKLNQFESQNRQYTKKAIFNKLLEEALEKYMD